MKYLSLVLLVKLFTLSACNNSVDPGKSEGKSINDIAQRISELEGEVHAWQNELNVPNVGIGIIEGGEIVHTTVYENIVEKHTVDKNMLFNVASVTKVVFTQLVLQLVNNNDWSLDEPLFNYHIDPDVLLDEKHKRITTRHILSQQSGFINWRWNHPTGKLHFDSEPGTTFNYSGEGMEYLRLAIEKKFNKSLSQLADSLLFSPLNMIHTRHAWDGITERSKFSLAYDTEGNLHDIEDHSTVDNAADDLITTVEDLSKFGLHLINNTGLSNQLFNEMIKPQVAINRNMDQGLGWRLIRGLSNHEYAIQHGGNDIGVASLIVLLPDSKRGIIILTNGDNGLFMCNNIVRSYWDDIGIEVIHRSYKSGHLGDAPKPIQLAVEDLTQFAGQYIQPSGRELSISIKDNGLLLQMPGTPNLALHPQTKDTFFLLDFDPKIVFTKDEEGRVNSALIVEGENTIRCEKKDLN